MSDQQSLRSACAYLQSDQSLCLSLEYSMIIKLLTEHHLMILSLKGGCSASSESTLVKMPHCWKSHVTAHLYIFSIYVQTEPRLAYPALPKQKKKEDTEDTDINKTSKYDHVSGSFLICLHLLSGSP